MVPVRTPRSADIANADVLRMTVGGFALALLGIRRYVFARPPLLGPSSRLAATGVTIFTGYPFLRGALRTLRGGRSAGTDLLVSAATIASLVLRENVVALTVLWLLNIGEYLQDLTLRRTRRAIANLLQGNQDTTWVRLADGTEVADEKTRANAHPGGDTPWQRADYEAKLADYTKDLVSDDERARFIAAVDGMDRMSGDELATINVIVDTGRLEAPDTRGIY